MAEFQVLIQGFIESKLAESGTNTTTIKIAAHGLSTGDMIVNEDRRYTYNNDPCSRIITVVDADTFTIPLAITGQTAGDRIRLYKYIDKTNYIKAGSLEVSDRMDRRNDCRFRMKVANDALLPRCGQNVKVLYNNELIFGGVIRQINKRRINADSVALFADIIVEGYNTLPSRRTVMANWSSPTYSKDIVKYVIDNYLVEEGITYDYAEFGDGYLWDEYPKDIPSNCISIAQILKDMADASGYKCYIDNNRKLHFKQEDTIVNAPYSLITGEDFLTDYHVRDIELEENQINYRNKVFFRGAPDDFGDVIVTWGEYMQGIKDRQDVEGGSGVYGGIIEDSEVDNTLSKTAEAGTTTTNIKITGHGLSTGDMIVNITRGNAKRLVTVVDSNNITVSAITSQAAGDEIRIYPDANKIVHNNIKRYGLVAPKEIAFTTDFMGYRAGQKLTVQLEEFGMSDPEYFLIEEVTFRDIDSINTQSVVKATSRANDNFSTQYTENSYDAYASFVGGGSTTLVRNGVNIYVGDNPPSNPKAGDLWCDTKGVINKSANATLTLLESDKVIQLTNTISITLPTPSPALNNINYIFKSRDSSTKTIVGTIDGATNYSLAGNNSVIRLYCDGSGWFTW